MDLALFYFLVLRFRHFMYVVCWMASDAKALAFLYPWLTKVGERDHLMRSISHVWMATKLGWCLAVWVFICCVSRCLRWQLLNL